MAQGLTARSKQETSQLPLSPDSPWFHQLVLRPGRVESSRVEEKIQTGNNWPVSERPVLGRTPAPRVTLVAARMFQKRMLRSTTPESLRETVKTATPV